MNKNRKLAKSKYSHKYKLINSDSSRCYYCGGPSECKDHFPALLNLLKYTSDAYDDIGYHKIPSCAECNCLLRDHDSASIFHRRIELKTRLHKKYRKILKSAEWSADEIKELDGQLREYVENLFLLKDWIERRLAYPHSDPYFWYSRLE